jgi:hypothetical protein
MSPHKKAHCNNLEDHLHGVNQQENEIDSFTVLCDLVNLLIESQEAAIDHNDEKNESIEPWINSYQLNNLVSEWIRHR